MPWSSTEGTDEKAEEIHADSAETQDNNSVAEKGITFQTRYVKSKAEKKYLRKVNLAFIPLVTWIVMVQVYTIFIISVQNPRAIGTPRSNNLSVNYYHYL